MPHAALLPSSRRASPAFFHTTFPKPSRSPGRRPQSGDEPQNVREHAPRHRDFGQLERDVTAMTDNFGADLDHLLPRARQRPRLRRLGHRQRPYEISEIVGESMKLKAAGVGGEGAARRPRPLDRALAVFDPLLAGAAMVVEGHNPLGTPGQVCHQEAYAIVFASHWANLVHRGAHCARPAAPKQGKESGVANEGAGSAVNPAPISATTPAISKPRSRGPRASASARRAPMTGFACATSATSAPAPGAPISPAPARPP